MTWRARYDAAIATVRRREGWSVLALLTAAAVGVVIIAADVAGPVTAVAVTVTVLAVTALVLLLIEAVTSNAAQHGWVAQPAPSRYALIATATAAFVWVFGLVPHWTTRPSGPAWLGLFAAVALTQTQATLAAVWPADRWPVPPMVATTSVVLLLVATVALLTRRTKRAG